MALEITDENFQEVVLNSVVTLSFLPGNRTIGVLAQKDPNIETPEKEDLNKIGTVAHILKMLRMPDGNITAIIQGRKRFEIEEFVIRF